MWPDLARMTAWNLRDFLFAFAFYYPLFMAWIWMIGGVWFYLRRERRKGIGPDNPDPLDESPPCSLLIPCFNEQDNVRDTVEYALAVHYPDFEVIAVNDGSDDRTATILDAMAKEHPRLRVVHLAKNQGKAVALRAAALAARHEFLVCIDGDALIHPYAVQWMMGHFVGGPRVGAVTGNPRILNRSTLLGKIQVGEFSSIIGLIKRAQRTYGRIFTVSGVLVTFRKSALERVGYWNEDMVTDDIDVSWRLQMDHWDIRYEPEALCYIYMPETLRGLWKQRLRWAQGGVEVLLRYTAKFKTWRHRRFWGVVLEYMASIAWAYVMLLIFALFFVGLFVELPRGWRVDSLLPQWNGTILGVTCLVQFLISLWIDRRYEHGRFLRNYFWVIWYPLLYWVLSMLTAVVALPKTLLRRRQRARWVSPDRGVRPKSREEVS
jgi:poly-beta-1,6-N-acetyl-D-glucosamine synthase